MFLKTRVVVNIIIGQRVFLKKLIAYSFLTTVHSDHLCQAVKIQCISTSVWSSSCCYMEWMRVNFGGNFKTFHNKSIPAELT